MHHSFDEKKHLFGRGQNKKLSAKQIKLKIEVIKLFGKKLKQGNDGRSILDMYMRNTVIC